MFSNGLIIVAMPANLFLLVDCFVLCVGAWLVDKFCTCKDSCLPPTTNYTIVQSLTIAMVAKRKHKRSTTDPSFSCFSPPVFFFGFFPQFICFLLDFLCLLFHFFCYHEYFFFFHLQRHHLSFHGDIFIPF